MTKQIILCLAAAILFLSGCDSNSTRIKPEKQNNSSIYITNAGNFTQSNGSISSYSLKTNTVDRAAFESANNHPFVGLIQSAAIFGNKFYIVSNKPNRIVVTDLSTLASLTTIPLGTSASAFLKVDDQTAYVTNLYNNSPVDSVAIIDLSKSEDTGLRIAVGDQPRRMVKVGHLVYVSNTGFGGSDSTISVINTETNKVIKTLDVGIAPKQMVVDRANQIWVVCGGVIAYAPGDVSRPGSVYIIDGENAMIMDKIPTGGHPSELVLDEKSGRGYLLDNGVKVLNLSTKKVIKKLFSAKNLRGIYYSPDQKMLYVGKITSYVQPGRVIKYNLKGIAVDSFKVGIAPKGIYSVGM